jgi:hypothetical protein
MTATAKKTARAKKIAEPVKPATRADLLTLLNKHGYTGPRSYTATTLSAVVEWLDAKAPKDQVADLPSGVVFAVHPDLRPAPAPKVRRLSKGYQMALADVLDHMDSDEGGGDVRKFCTERLASA